MSRNLWLAVAAASLIAAGAATASAQSGPESANQNVRESQQYEGLVCSNAAFRAKRIAQECGPISDPQLHQNCLASFDCGPAGPKGAQWRKAPPSETIR
jgi:hypothetical protein